MASWRSVTAKYTNPSSDSATASAILGNTEARQALINTCVKKRLEKTEKETKIRKRLQI
jgi:hypothetical protein